MKTNFKLASWMHPFSSSHSLFALLLIATLVSCQFEEPTPVTPELLSPKLEKPVAVINGRLVIQSPTDYQNLRMFFTKHQGHSETWKQWIGQLEGFTSMDDAFYNMTEAEMEQIGQTGSPEGFDAFLLIREVDGELEAETHVPNPFLGQLVNAEGILQIGDIVEKHFYDHKIALENPSESEIVELSQMKMTDRPTKGEWLPITRSIELNLGSQLRAGNNNCKNEYASSPKRRINATLIFESSCFFTPGIGCAYTHDFYSTVKNQRRNFRIWWARTADEISTTGTRSTDYPDPNSNWTPGTFNASDTDVSFLSTLVGTYEFQTSSTPIWDTDITADNFVDDKASGSGSCDNDMNY